MKYLTQYVPQGSGISDGYVAIEEAGVLKAQKLSFDGTTATPDGTAEVIDNVGLFATGMDEPAYEGSDGGSTEKPEKEMPTDGLVFYAPLAEASDTAETGQILTTNGSVDYSTVSGVPCMSITNSSGYVSAPASTLPSGAEPRSICFWAMWSNADDRFVGYGGDGEDERFALGTGDTSNLLILDAAYNNYCRSSVYPRTDTLTFFAISYDGNELALYIDGRLASKETASLNTTADSVLKIGYWNDYFKMQTGYISSVRCYNRVLSVSEIILLASEFDEDNGSNNDCVSKYYKCASVDTANMTWSGYELILTDGAYSVSDVVTEGLSYSAVTPVVNYTYSADALIKIDTYYMGLPVPWLDLPLDSVNCKTGQTVTSLSSAFSYDDVLKRNVLTTPGLSVSFEDTYSGDVSLAVLFRTTQSSEGYISTLMLAEGIKDGRININSGHAPFYGTFNDGSWHLLIATYNTTDAVAYCYVDNIYQGALTESDIKAWGASYNGFLMNNPFYIGCYSPLRDYQWYGAISSYKVYKKILDENERTAIYNDFILQKTQTTT